MKSSRRIGRWGIILATACLLLITIGALDTAKANYYALTVGIDSYRAGYASSLGSCVNDARGFRTRLLKDSTRWKSYRINTLVNSSATESNIKRRLRLRASQLRRGDIFVYFHSSHGGRYSGARTFLCSYSSDFTDRELAVELARFRSGVRIIVVLDACYSGGMFKDGTTEDWPFADNVMLAFRDEKSKTGISKSADLDKLNSYMGFMTACDYYQTCWAGSPYSLYTRYIIQATGDRAADTTPRNTYLSCYEAHRYARPRAYAKNRGQKAQHYNTSLLSRTTLIKQPVVLTVPVQIGPTGVTVARPLFTWRSVLGATRYDVQIYNSAGRLIVNRRGVTSASWSPSSNLANGTYSWRVRAACGTKYSRYSAKLPFVVSPAGAFLRRATLTWGSTPRDLDSHLGTPTGAHIYYPTSSRGHQTYAPYSQLDVDDRYSYGPENISVYRYTSGSSRYYKYYVYNWSNERNLAGCGARVSVQNRYRVLRNYLIPSSGSGRYWHVFNMSSSGSITSVNRIRSTRP